MRKCLQNNLRRLLITTTFIILAVRCQDEIGFNSSSSKEEFTVEDAKEFFETNVDALSVDLQLKHAKAGKLTREQNQGKNRVITPELKAELIQSEMEAHLYIGVVNSPEYYENEIQTYEAEFGTNKYVSNSYNASRKFVYWRMKQEYEISKKHFK